MIDGISAAPPLPPETNAVGNSMHASLLIDFQALLQAMMGNTKLALNQPAAEEDGQKSQTDVERGTVEAEGQSKKTDETKSPERLMADGLMVLPPVPCVQTAEISGEGMRGVGDGESRSRSTKPIPQGTLRASSEQIENGSADPALFSFMRPELIQTAEHGEVSASPGMQVGSNESQVEPSSACESQGSHDPHEATIVTEALMNVDEAKSSGECEETRQQWLVGLKSAERRTEATGELKTHLADTPVSASSPAATEHEQSSGGDRRYGLAPVQTPTEHKKILGTPEETNAPTVQEVFRTASHAEKQNVAIQKDAIRPVETRELAVGEVCPEVRAPMHVERLTEQLAGPELRFGWRSPQAGTLQVSTSLHDRTVELGIAADRQEVASALRSELPVLESGLQQHALRLGETHIAFSHALNAHAQMGEQRRGQQEWRSARLIGRESSGPETESTIPLRGYQQGGRISLLA